MASTGHPVRVSVPDGEPMHSAEHARQQIQYVCDLWDRHQDSSATFRDGIEIDSAIAIHTLAHHAVQLGRALLSIDDAAPGVVVLPTVRLIFECGVTCSWLLLTPRAGTTLLRDGAKARKIALDELVNQGVEGGPGLAQAERTLERLGVDLGNTAAASMQYRCLALHDGPRLYSIYRILSGFSHAGMTLVDEWISEDERSPIGLSFDPDPSFDTRSNWLAIASVMLFQAVNADAQARRHPHQTAQRRKAARRIGTTTAIRRADGTQLPSRRARPNASQ